MADRREVESTPGPTARPPADPPPPAAARRSREFRIVASESVASNLGNQLTAAAVVLPFIAVALGGPLLAATLIYPVSRWPISSAR